MLAYLAGILNSAPAPELQVRAGQQGVLTLAELSDKSMTNNQHPMICVVLVNYNSGACLRHCLEKLNDQIYRDFEVIVVDNASDDNSIALANSLLKDLRVLQPGSNTGFATANNLAVKETQATWIATLNVDAFAEADWLQQLIEATKRYPEVVMFGSTQIFADRPGYLDGAGDVYHASGVTWRGAYNQSIDMLPAEGEIFAPCAAAALYRRDVFEAVDGFDEKYFCYHEDVDLGFRLRHAGYHAIQVPKAVVHHKGSAISGRRSAFTVYHGSRNRFWTFTKNMPLLALFMLMPVHILMSLITLLVAAKHGTFVATLRGYSDGLMGLGQIVLDRRILAKSKNTSSLEILRALSWSPIALLRRNADVRPYRHAK